MLSCGEAFTVVILQTDEGKKICTCGENVAGLGLRDRLTERMQPVQLPAGFMPGNLLGVQFNNQQNMNNYNTSVLTPIPSLENIELVMVSCGTDSTLGLDNQGNIYGWGSNYNNVLSSERDPESDAPTIINLPDNSQAVYICMGSTRAAAVDSLGRVWIWGVELNIPTLIPGLNNILTAEISENILIALDYNGNVWEWTSENGIQQITSTGDVIKIGIYRVHNRVALTNKGELLLWRSDWNNMGREQTTTPVNKHPTLTGIINISRGVAAFDCYAIDRFGTLTGLYERQNSETIYNTGIIDLAVGAGFMIGIDFNGFLYGKGSNEQGQLGLGFISEEEPVFRQIDRAQILNTKGKITKNARKRQN